MLHTVRNLRRIHDMQLLPPSMGIYLELMFPNISARSNFDLGRGHRLNPFVDAVLKAVFAVPSTSPSGRQHLSTGRRKIVFSSFEPNVCTALNWKQPNCRSGLWLVDRPLTPASYSQILYSLRLNADCRPVDIREQCQTPRCLLWTTDALVSIRP